MPLTVERKSYTRLWSGAAALLAPTQKSGCEALSKIPHFLVHHHEDNVGVVVVEDLQEGTDMMGVVTADNSTTKCKSRDDIPIGHKVALTGLKKGDTIIKYGVDIGIMTADAKKGDHVHVHNLKTKKW